MVKLTEGHVAGSQPMRAPRGAAISCKGWEQEAALRMLLNGLDPEVAEVPEDIVGSRGPSKPARDGKSMQAMIAALQSLKNDETLVVQGSEVSAILHTHVFFPRVLIMNASSAGWVYTGIQAFLEGAYAAFDAAARAHFQGSLAGKLAACAGMDARGGALALGATLHGAAFLGIDADTERIKRRVKAGYCDVMVNDLDEALRILKNAVRKREAASVGLAANGAVAFAELARRGVVPDLLAGRTVHTEAIAVLEKMGAWRLDSSAGASEDRHPFFWAALSGEPADIYRADALLLEMFPRDEMLRRWLPLVRKRARFEGLPARVCRLGFGERRAFALALNDLAARGELKAPMALGHGEAGELPDQLDAVAGGTKEMAKHIERVFGDDPGSAIVRRGSHSETIGFVR